MTPGETASLLKLWALEEGFDRAGVAQLRPSENGEAYLRWIEAGRHAGMEYLARRVEKRLDPQDQVPGARSVLCVAQQYALGGQKETGEVWPRVAVSISFISALASSFG